MTKVEHLIQRLDTNFLATALREQRRRQSSNLTLLTLTQIHDRLHSETSRQVATVLFGTEEQVAEIEPTIVQAAIEFRVYVIGS